MGTADAGLVIDVATAIGGAADDVDATLPGGGTGW